MARPALNIENFSSEKNFIQSAVRLIKSVRENSEGIIRIALSGGSTPKPIYEALAKDKALPFNKIEFYLVDERYVPANNKDSNQKMIRKALIKPLGKKLKAFHYFNTSLPLAKSLQKYGKELPRSGFDLIILGIGPDGHTASLFPHNKALNEKKRPVAVTTTTRFAVKQRLTLTFPPILKSKKILVLLRGKEKAAILKKLANAKVKPSDFPAKLLLKHPNLQIYFCR